jgi:hypothetical protein
MRNAATISGRLPESCILVVFNAATRAGFRKAREKFAEINRQFVILRLPKVRVVVEPKKVRIGERFSVSFQRTLRIPDDGKAYPLPPSLGTFPVHRAEDFPKAAPAEWKKTNDLFIPMYQREALWLSFKAARWKPNAVKIGVGRINAVSGEVLDDQLHDDPQDYVVCPDQPWLDGINAGDGLIRQFVAMPLGQGLTIEAQLTGAEEFGGIQIIVYEPKRGRFPSRQPPESDFDSGSFGLESIGEMGLGAGGKMKQKIYPDHYGIETWNRKAKGSVCLHIVNSRQYQELTGSLPPPTPISPQDYTDNGLPWFDLYDETQENLAAPEKLRRVKSIKEMEARKGITVEKDEPSLRIKKSRIRKLPGK